MNTALAATFADIPRIGGFSILTLMLAGIVAFAVMLVVYGLVSGQARPDEISLRLERYTEASTGSARAPHGNSPRELFEALSESLNRVLSRSARTGKLADDLAKADLKLKPSEWFMGVLGIGTLLGVLLWARFSAVILVLAGPLIAYVISGVVLKVLQARRARAFDNQLGDTITLLANALKAGYSFAQAIATVSKTAQPPIADEFSRATREMALGISVDDALDHMVKRNQSEDFDLMVTAVQMNRVVGGNLAEILDTIATTIRERVRIKGEIRTLTAQARTSGWIIMALPIGLAAILTVISPEFFTPMFRETLGRIMLIIGGFSMLMGFAIIQKIVKIEV